MTTLSVALSALRAQQQAMQVTSQNIANAGTDGYSAQRAVLTADALRTGGGTLHGGVTIAGISSLRDRALDARIRDSTSESSRLAALSSVAGDIEALLGTLDGTNLQSQMEDVAAAFNDLAADPADDAVASAAADSLSTLCALFNQISSGLDDVAASAVAQAQDAATDANQAMDELAALNLAIQRTSPSGGTSEYADRQAQLLERIAGSLQIDARFEDDGSVQVSCGGLMLVSGSSAHHIAVEGTAAGGIRTVLEGSGVRIGDAGGALGAYEEAVDADIPAIRSTLDALAQGLISYLGRLQAAGAAGGDGGAAMTGETVLSAAQAAQDLDAVELDAVHGLGFPAALAPDLPDSGSCSVMRLVARDAGTGLSDGYILTYDAGSGTTPASCSLQDLVDAINNGSGGGFALVPPAGGALQASLVPSGGGYRLRLETTDGRTLDIGSALDQRPSDTASAAAWPTGNAGFSLTGAYTGGASYDVAQPMAIRVTVAGTIGDASVPPTIEVSMPVEDGGVVTMQTTTYVLDAQHPAGVPIDLGNGLSITFDAGGLAAGSQDLTVAVDACDDRTGLITALGLDGVLAGTGAADIHLARALESDPARLATGASSATGASDIALEMAVLATTATVAGGSTPVLTAYQQLVAGIGRTVSDAESLGETQDLVQATLGNQRQLLIGVDVDTQMATLIEQQQAYSAAAKVITMVRENNQTLMSILG